MARGGYRPGSGRPKGSGKGKTPAVPSLKFPAAVDSAAQEAGLSPMDYLLRLMRNPAEDPALRARAAALLLPFLHPRTVEAGKKTKAQEAAATAQDGTDWEELLNPRPPH